MYFVINPYCITITTYKVLCIISLIFILVSCPLKVKSYIFAYNEHVPDCENESLVYLTITIGYFNTSSVQRLLDKYLGFSHLKN